jgi:hypothetical protein
MFSVPYVNLQTVVTAGPQLLAGMVARMRTIDVQQRMRLGMPAYCPDLSVAVANGPSNATYEVIREADFGKPSKVAVFVQGFDYKPYLAAATVAIQTAEKAAAAAAMPPSTPSAMRTPVGQRPSLRPGMLTPSSSSSSFQTSSGGPPKSTAASRAAAKAAALKEEEDRKARKAAASAMSHFVHASCVLLQVMDAAVPPLTSAAEDSGLETALLASGFVKLPPTDSVDRLLLSQSSRLIYSLAGMIASAWFGPVEQSFVTRPTGGAAIIDWRYGFKTLTEFPLKMMPDVGPDAVATAASLLRTLWERLPMLRTVIAHVCTASFLNICNGVGDLKVKVFRKTTAGGTSKNASRASVAGQGDGSATHEGGGGGDEADDDNGFVVTIPEEVVQARILGVLMARLEAEPGSNGIDAASSSSLALKARTFGYGRRNSNNNNTNSRYRSGGGNGARHQGHSNANNNNNGNESDDGDDGNGTPKSANDRNNNSRNGSNRSSQNRGNVNSRAGGGGSSGGGWDDDGFGSGSGSAGFDHHPLAQSVEMRLKNTTVKRIDGVVLGTTDVETFDETLC